MEYYYLVSHPSQLNMKPNGARPEGLPVTGAELIPAEVLTLIAHYFTSARDVVSLGSVCKRYSTILLRPQDDITSPQMQFLLSLVSKIKIAVSASFYDSPYDISLTEEKGSLARTVREWRRVPGNPTNQLSNQEFKIQLLELFGFLEDENRLHGKFLGSELIMDSFGPGSPGDEREAAVWSKIIKACPKISISDERLPVFLNLVNQNAFMISETPYYLNKKNGEEIEYFWDYPGQIRRKVSWMNGLHHGLSLMYFPSGLVHTSLMWDNDEMHGAEKIYNEQGNLYCTHIFVHNKLEGEDILYSPATGEKISSTLYEGGKRVLRQTFYDDGSLSSVTPFVNNVAEGQVISFHQNGTVSSMSHHKAGRQHGDGVAYYVTGEKESQWVYENGKEIWYRQWASDGKLISSREAKAITWANKVTGWVADKTQSQPDIS